MNPKQYIEETLRTESVDLTDIRERLNSPRVIRLLHAAIGKATENGEFLDALKKHIFYGRDLDIANLKEEIGDGLWYDAIALDELGGTFEGVMSTNIAKLRARYPEKFTKEKAEVRDLDTERSILENG